MTIPPYEQLVEQLGREPTDDEWDTFLAERVKPLVEREKQLLDPFYVELPPLGTLYKIEYGDPLSEDEEVAWAGYRKRVEDAEARRSLLGIVDLAEVMREGSTDPEMLVEGMLVASEHHLLYGTKESGKTWLLLRAVGGLLSAGQTVVWVDKEMGRKNLADRFLTLGVPADAVEDHLVYLEYPTMDAKKESRALWRTLLDSRAPRLMVVDAFTEVLADADLNENSGTDIEKWMKAYITPARRVGVATVMIDHTGHDTSGRAVSSRQKGAGAKIELEVVKTAGFSREAVGGIEVRLNKNTVSAPIPEVRYFRIGGTPDGFILQPTDMPSPDAGAQDSKQKQAAARFKIRVAVEAELRRRAGTKLSKNQMRGLVTGTDKLKDEALASLAAGEDSPVQAEPTGRGVVYWYPADDLGVAGLVPSPPPTTPTSAAGNAEVRRGQADSA